jgi:hypothetical protein
VISCTAPLDNLANLINFESRIPKKLLTVSGGDGNRSALRIRDLMSHTTLGGLGGVAEVRMTSVAERAQRQTKRDVEEMHQILLRKKHASLTLRGTERTDYSHTTGDNVSVKSREGGGESMQGLTASFKKAIKRPSTPDLTR